MRIAALLCILPSIPNHQRIMDQVLAGVQCALEGRYTVECEFSRGGMATVFLAGDLSMPGVSGSDSPKAVKVHTKGQL